MKILLVAMGLDIGGAETHVVSLAKELKDKGHIPVVISSGGVYVKELNEKGISHYCAPLNKKSISSTIESIRAMSRVIKEENVDIIHSHGRIPALIGKIASILYSVPFMTTVHAKVHHKGPYKYLSFWGEEIISISNDIKEHLVKNFGVEENKITLIRNGIETDKFIPMSPNAEINSELGLYSTSKKVVYISRISDNLAKLVRLVLEAASKINAEKEEVEFIIVGDGEDFYDINRIGNEINQRLGKKVIHILGKRTDIAQIISLADTTICVSRTALEAMACEKSVILAGGEGYMGILTEENLQQAISNNFTGRTFSKEVTAEVLEDDILSILNDDKEQERSRLGRLGREVVTDSFSIKYMTEQTILVYERLLKRRNKR